MRKGLELIVEEPLPGRFCWSVLGREVFGEPRRVIDCAASPYPTRRQALEAGTVAIRRHMEPQPMGAKSYRQDSLRVSSGPEAIA